MLSKPTKLVSSSYHKVTIVTTPRDLIKICTKYAIPYIEQNTGRDKVNFEFEFETESGVYFTVYDWKEYQPLKIDNEYEFHIGGVNTLDCLDGLDALKKEFNLDFDERLKWFELNERAFNKVYSKVQSLNLKIDMQEEDIENGIYGRDVSRDQAIKVLHEDRVDFTAWSYILKLIENEIIHK